MKKARAYLEFARKSFQNNIVYRADYFAGVISTLATIIVNIAIWKAIYGGKETFDGVHFKMVVTNFILGLAISSIFGMNEWLIEGKIRTGSIATDLLRPISFRLYLFSHQLGDLFFKLVMQLAPTLLISIIFIGLLPPASLFSLLCFISSLILGYLVLYNLNFIVSISAFWTYQVWSLITLKNAILLVLSGVLLPIWFMPRFLVDFIKFTPFDTIYFIPISIYLGKIGGNEIIFSIGKQLLWIILLLGVGHILWKAAAKKLVIQGG